MAPHVAELLFGVNDVVFYMVLEAFAWSTFLGLSVFLSHVYKSQGLAVHAISFFIFFEYFWVSRFGFGLEWCYYDIFEGIPQMDRLLFDFLIFLKIRRIAMDIREQQQNLPQNRVQPPMPSRRERRQRMQEQQREQRRERRRSQGNPSPRIHDDDKIAISPTGDNSNDSATNGMRQIRGVDKMSAAVRARVIRSRHVHKKHYVATTTDTEAASLGIKP